MVDICVDESLGAGQVELAQQLALADVSGQRHQPVCWSEDEDEIQKEAVVPARELEIRRIKAGRVRGWKAG